MPGAETLKRLIGREVDIDEPDGHHHHGRLVDVGRRSVWLVEDDEDTFIPLDAVTDLRAG